MMWHPLFMGKQNFNGNYCIKNFFSRTFLDNFLPQLQTLSILHPNKPINIRPLSSILSTIRFRKHVSLPGLLSSVRTSLAAIPDPVNHRGFSLVEGMMAGVAVFMFKTPSLLDLDRSARGQDGQEFGGREPPEPVWRSPCSFGHRPEGTSRPD